MRTRWRVARGPGAHRDRIAAATRERLTNALRVLDEEYGSSGDPGAPAQERLGHYVAAVGEPAAWLALAAATGALPESEDVVDLRRRCVAAGPAAGAELLEARAHASRATDASRPLVVTRRIVVDVDFSARHDANTGVQRTVRRTLPHWVEAHDPELVAWDADHHGPRSLTPPELHRVLRWDAHHSGETGQAAVGATGSAPLVVPWRTTYLMPEVPMPGQARRLAALARHSGSRVVAVGYDCIPVVSADLLERVEAVKFMQYLGMVKHVDVVAAISASAAEEFRGHARMLAAQGLRGPDVAVVPLATEVPGAVPAEPDDVASRRAVVVVGSQDPRKNQTAVLHAAERLWREGLTFSLRFLGGRGWRGEDLERGAARLAAQGFDVEVRHGVTDRDLWEGYRSARFTAFLSRHEGFGLPIVESRAFGVPVLTSRTGSTGELAAQGGAVAVDPVDDDEVCREMRRLLTDDEVIRSLARECRDVPVRTWDDYAAELWRAAHADRPVEPARPAEVAT